MKDWNPIDHSAGLDISGYDSHEGYREILRILGYMSGVPKDSLHIYDWKEWKRESVSAEKFDAVGIYMPEGAGAGSIMAENEDSRKLMDAIGNISKGELPFLLSAFSMLKEDGVLAAILPGALLYREGRESQLRRFLVKEQNGLDMVMLLPDRSFRFSFHFVVMIRPCAQRKFPEYHGVAFYLSFVQPRVRRYSTSFSVSSAVSRRSGRRSSVRFSDCSRRQRSILP